MRNLMIAVLGVCATALGACGYADPISQSRYGGVLALEGDESLAMDEAERLMRAHCGDGNYRVERIDKVLVDEEDYVTTAHDDAGNSETHAGTAEAFQLQVTYRCLVPQSPPF